MIDEIWWMLNDGWMMDGWWSVSRFKQTCRICTLEAGLLLHHTVPNWLCLRAPGSLMWRFDVIICEAWFGVNIRKKQWTHTKPRCSCHLWGCTQDHVAPHVMSKGLFNTALDTHLISHQSLQKYSAPKCLAMIEMWYRVNKNRWRASHRQTCSWPCNLYDHV